MRLLLFMYPRKSVAFWLNYHRKSVVNAGFYPRKSVFLEEIPHFYLLYTSGRVYILIRKPD